MILASEVETASSSGQLIIKSYFLSDREGENKLSKADFFSLSLFTYSLTAAQTLFFNQFKQFLMPHPG